MRLSCWAIRAAECGTRLAELSEAIKRVYASTFSQHAKAYVRATPYRLEEEKMAVILQQVVGMKHEAAKLETTGGTSTERASIRIFPASCARTISIPCRP